MNYVVFDLEWNYPNDIEKQNRKPNSPAYEVVEIGAVKLDEDFKTVDELRLLIRPQFYPKMHRFVAALTGVHDKTLQSEGIPFPEAYEKFSRWCGDDFIFMTWSQSDVPALAENMRAFGIDTSHLPDLVDLQRIFDREIMRTDRSVSLEEAMSVLNERGDRAHDALHDAQNTVKVCSHLDLDTYLGEYITHYYDLELIDTVYDSPEQILGDETAAEVTCPICGKPMHCEGWIPARRFHQISCAACEEDGEFLVNLSWNSTEEGKFRAGRTMYYMSDDLWDQYCDKKDAFESKSARM